MGKFTLPWTITLDETFKFELHTGKLEQKAQKTNEIIKKDEMNRSNKYQFYAAVVYRSSHAIIRECSCSMADKKL